MGSDLSQIRSERRSKRIQWSAMSGLVSSGVIACISIFSAPITINYLGKDLYGLWSIITSFLVWAQLLDFGILNGLTNALSEAFGRDDYPAAQNYICISFLITSLISAAGIILWIIGSFYVPWSVFIKVDTTQQAHLLGKGICIVGCFFLLTLPFLLTQRVLHAYQKLYIYHLINLISYLLGLFVLCLGVHYRLDLLSLLLATSSVPLVCQAIGWCVLTKKLPFARFSWKYVQFAGLKRIAHSSIQILAIQVNNIITSQLIPILLTSVATLKDVADFSILWKIYIFVYFVLGNISTAYMPGIRDAFERGEIDWIKRSLKRLILYQTSLVLAGCLPVLIAGDWIIETWIRMPLEHSLGFSGWLVYTLCILFSVLACTFNSALVILDRMVFLILIGILSSGVLFLAIMKYVPQIGLITIFGVMGLTSFLSLFYSIRALDTTLKRKTSRV